MRTIFGDICDLNTGGLSVFPIGQVGGRPEFESDEVPFVLPKDQAGPNLATWLVDIALGGRVVAHRDADLGREIPFDRSPDPRRVLWLGRRNEIVLYCRDRDHHRPVFPDTNATIPFRIDHLAPSRNRTGIIRDPAAESREPDSRDHLSHHLVTSFLGTEVVFQSSDKHRPLVPPRLEPQTGHPCNVPPADRTVLERIFAIFETPLMSNMKIVVYSNGIADFQRSYRVGIGGPTRIAIPVRQAHLADVLASFVVLGPVTLDAPPTFRPANAMEGNLDLNETNVVESLVTGLSGARVRVVDPSGTLEGRLVGLHVDRESTGGQAFETRSLVVLTDAGIRRTSLRSLQKLDFLDDEVRLEIDKALRRNYEKIKPDSTFVELSLSAEGPSDPDAVEAVVQYTIPAAAWKISYRLRLAEGRPTELQGFAVVDNHTEEDWVDATIRVVTGEPITFSTDLAESKSPIANASTSSEPDRSGQLMLRSLVGKAPVEETTVRKDATVSASPLVSQCHRHRVAL